MKRSRRSHVGRTAPALVLLLGCAFARDARAQVQACDAGDAVCGREAFGHGTASFDRGEYLRAEEWFTAAAAAEAHPVVLYNLAVARARSGKAVAACALFDDILADPRTDETLRKRTERERTLAAAKIARVSIELAEPTSSRVVVDGAPVNAIGSELLLDPGLHRFRVFTREQPVYEQDVELSAGERLRLRVTSGTRAMDVVVVPPTETPLETPPEAPPPERPRTSGVRPIWFVTSTALTGLLASATIWSGLDVQSAHSRYRSDLPRLTQQQADARVAEGHRRERRTNVLLAVTGVAAAGSAVLGVFFVDWGPSATGSRSQGPRLDVGLSGAQLTAPF